jgi:DNA invertase Pin-like site-specific DNA recombinase
METKKPSGRGKGYARVSSDQQESARQLENIRLWCQKHNLGEIEILQEVGRRHESDKRSEFQKLLRLIDSGDVDFVVVDAQDRLGFSRPSEYGKFWHIFDEAGVDLWSATDDRLLTGDDTANVVMSNLGAIASKTEMVTKSTRDLGKKREMAKLGHYTGGWPPYGTDIICLSSASKLRWRCVGVGKWEREVHFADGRVQRYDGKANMIKDRQVGDILTWAPTIKTDRIKVLNFIFKTFVKQAISINGLAQQLNRLGFRHTHGVWYAALLTGVLKNPAAIGRPSYNKRPRGLYSELTADGSLSTDLPKRKPKKGHKRAAITRNRPREQWIGPTEQLYGPLVPVSLFEKAQKKLAEIKGRPKAPRSDRLWLSGLMHCAKCGTRMTGWYYAGWESYACQTYRRSRVNDSGCRLHRVKQATIEHYLQVWLKEISQDISDVQQLDLAGLLTATGETRAKLAGIIPLFESYLIEHLDEYTEPELLEDGRRRYSIELPDGPIELVLPGCTDSGALQEVFDFLRMVRSKEDKAKRSELEKELDRLSAKYDDIPSETIREKIKAQMAEAEAQLDRLKQVPELSQNYRRLQADLWKPFKTIAKFRKESNVRHKADLIRKLLDRIEVSYTYSQHGKQERSTWSEIRFVPADLNPPRTFSNLSPPGPG